jgi:hypothetical protein
MTPDARTRANASPPTGDSDAKGLGDPKGNRLGLGDGLGGRPVGGLTIGLGTGIGDGDGTGIGDGDGIGGTWIGDGDGIGGTGIGVAGGPSETISRTEVPGSTLSPAGGTVRITEPAGTSRLFRRRALPGTRPASVRLARAVGSSRPDTSGTITGAGVGWGLGEGDGDGLGEGASAGTGVGAGEGDGLGEGNGVGVGGAVGGGEGVIAGVGGAGARVGDGEGDGDEGWRTAVGAGPVETR